MCHDTIKSALIKIHSQFAPNCNTLQIAQQRLFISFRRKTLTYWFLLSIVPCFVRHPEPMFSFEPLGKRFTYRSRTLQIAFRTSITSTNSQLDENQQKEKCRKEIFNISITRQEKILPHTVVQSYLYIYIFNIVGNRPYTLDPQTSWSHSTRV